MNIENVNQNVKFKYLIVEDSLKVCNGIKSRLDEYTHWECTGFAHHVQDALTFINSERPSLIFLDWALKGGSSFEILKLIKEIMHYDPYIIFNTGYQSEKPEIPQEIINNHKVDKYLVKPLWEKLRENLSLYLKEASEKHTKSQRAIQETWLEDIFRKKHLIKLKSIVCIQQHFDLPYCKMLYFNDGSHIIIKANWQSMIQLLEDSNLNFFITNSKYHIIIKEYIHQYKRPYVIIDSFKQKIEVVKNKLSAFEKWLSS